MKLGSLDGEAGEVEDGCEFDSCPKGSPAVGFNSSDPRLNYVNSFPVTSMAYGISTLSPKWFQGPPDLAVSGPNVGGLRPYQVWLPTTVLIRRSKSGHPRPIFWHGRGSCRSYQDWNPSYRIQRSYWSAKSMEPIYTSLLHSLRSTCNQPNDHPTQLRKAVSP